MLRPVVCCRYAAWISCRVGSERTVLQQPNTHFARLSLVWKRSFTEGGSGRQPRRLLTPRQYRNLTLLAGLGVAWVYRWTLLEPFFPVKHGEEDATGPDEHRMMDRARSLVADLTKSLSRTWGHFTSTQLPVWLRTPLYTLYIKTFNCNMEEVDIKDLKHYKSIQEFFTRQLEPGVRPVDGQHCVVSPSDGKILHFGTVEHGRVEQVKGTTYSLHGFLGETTWPTHWGMATYDRDDERYIGVVKHNPDTLLYHCVIYLAPGDYHGFHSPANWTATLRRHFPGSYLLSVRPSTVSWIPDIYILNERVVLLGDWQHGFFSMAAVGAYNVGSIRIFADKELKTNQKHEVPAGVDPLSLHFDNKNFVRDGDSETPKPREAQGLTFVKGDSVGEFNMGSTIVLIFEAPKYFEFSISGGQEIKYGQPIGTCTGRKDASIKSKEKGSSRFPWSA